ncbi:MAG: type III-A CRISPR-associated RAMP protein Csm3 [bacterium]
MNKEMYLKEYQVIKGKIRCLTGLHIGGTTETIEIGGMDNPIIKHPITHLPYIPGSSLKGKLRSLLEWKLGKIEEKGEVHSWCSNKECIICRAFGTSSDEAELGPTRLIFRDANLEGAKDCPKAIKENQEEECPNLEVAEVCSKEDKNEKCPFLKERKGLGQICEKEPQCSYGLLEQLRRTTGRLYAEEKTENTINRLTARANPRTCERVPAGIAFDFEMVFRVFDDGDEGTIDQGLFETIKKELILLEQDCLGGSGSRGYGKIAFEDIKTETVKVKK